MADSQEKSGDLYRLQGRVEITYEEVRLTADQVDYNEATGEVTAAGNVHFQQPARNEDIRASRGHYNLKTSTGSFYEVEALLGGNISAGSSLVTTTNPFFFEAERVDRIDEETYRVRNGEVTACSLPDPTWTFKAPDALIRPGVSAHLYHSRFRLLGVPVFYLPYLYRSLRRIPRSSGFLMPTLGSSSRLGTVLGDSFYWAIHRSADLEVGAEWLSKRGWSQNATFRMRPARESYLNVTYFGVVDRGFGPQKVDQGGRTARVESVTAFPQGFRAVIDANYLSSLTFREAFTQTFNEAVNSEVHSRAFLGKNFDSLSFNTLFSRFENFQSVRPRDKITIRHLPRMEFNSVERPLWPQAPLWLSWNSSLGVVRRREAAFGDRLQLSTPHVKRIQFFPRLTLPLQWKSLGLATTFGYRATHYGGHREGATFSEEGLNRGTRELQLDLVLPPLSRVFTGAGPLYGRPLKHVIEPRASFRHVSGVRDFAEILLFDQEDLLTDTTELEYSLTNRLLRRRETGGVREVLSWELRQQYYFDPDFGGALLPGQRNVFVSSLGLSSHAFLDTPRRFSPVLSIIRVRPSGNYDIEFRQDYDTTRGRLTHGGLVGNVRWGDSFASISHFFVRSAEALSPPSNQLRFLLGHGNLGKPGLNAAFAGTYDIRGGFLQFSALQVSYNNDCCGISFEFRRFALGPVRNENQFRVAFSLANVGTFGNLKKQERLF